MVHGTPLGMDPGLAEMFHSLPNIQGCRSKWFKKNIRVDPRVVEVVYGTPLVGTRDGGLSDS